MRYVLAKANIKGHMRGGRFVGPYTTKAPPAASSEKNGAMSKKVSDLFHGKFHDDYDDHSKWKGEGGQGGFWSKPAKSYPDAIDHPGLKEDGGTMKINEPDTSTDSLSWADPDEAAVYAVGGKIALPAELNGVELSPWLDAPVGDEWDYVDGQMEDLDEPTLHVTLGKEAASGVIIEEPDGRVWIVSPTNGFGGYSNVFPKGKAEDEMSFQANAIKEAYEESGLKVEITGLLGDFDRMTSVTRYYTARRMGGTPAGVGWETQAVRLVPRAMLADLMSAKYDGPIIEKITGKSTG